MKFVEAYGRPYASTKCDPKGSHYEEKISKIVAGLVPKGMTSIRDEH